MQGSTQQPLIPDPEKVRERLVYHLLEARLLRKQLKISEQAKRDDSKRSSRQVAHA